MKSKSLKGTINKSNNKTTLARASRKGALLSAAATIGLLSTAGDHNDGPHAFAQAIQVHERLKMQQKDVVNNDDIGKSSADDMFAFSQIVAAGGNPMEVAQQMEKEQAAKKVEEKNVGGLSEDQAVAAFAEFMSGEGSTVEKPDPVKIQAMKDAAEKAAKAQTELKELSTNDATSAFACLVDSQVIQEKAVTYEGSGTQAEEEAAVAKHKTLPKKQPKQDPLIAVQQQSEEELLQANKQVEVTDTAQQAVAQLGGAGNVQIAEDNAKAPAKSIDKGKGMLAETGAAKGSKLQTQINRLKSGYTVSDLKKTKAKPAAPAKKKPQPAKKAAPAKKAKAGPASRAKAKQVQKVAAPAAALEPERAGVDLQASIAASQAKDEEQVDNQADEILDQIRSAAVGIKGIGGQSGDGLDETSLQAAMKGMNLVQLDSDIKDHDLADENAQLAMDYLAQQFPEEYPHDAKPKPPPAKVPTPEETAAAEKQAMLQYAQQVTEEATESRDKVVQEIAEKQEREKLSRMGMEGEPVTLQLSSENLLQVGANVQFDADALEAQAYLETQFPADYPKDEQPKKEPPRPSEEELEKKQSKQLLILAEQVTAAATESRDKVVKAIEEKKEREELSKMGLDAVQKPKFDWKDLEAKRQHTLLQLSSDVVVDNGQVDENVEIAQAYLEQQFPDDYPKPPPPPKPVPKGPSAEEIAEKERKALIAYSASVADDAKAYQQELKNKEIAKIEEKELSKMGYEETFKPEYAPQAPHNAALPDARLVQLSQEIKIDQKDDGDMFDPDAKRALDYLSQQFPKDFPPEKAPPKPIKVVPKEVTEENERQKELKRSQAARQLAEEYHSELDKKEKERKEKEEIAKLTNEDLQLVQTENGSRAGQISLAQVDQKNKQGLVSELEVEERAGAGEYLEEGAEAEGSAQAAPAYQGGAAAQNDLSGMSADDMRSYSESVAQAADVVNNESEAENKKDPEGMSLGDLKKASIASAKAEKEASAKNKRKNAAKPAPREDQQLLDQEQKGLDLKNPDLEAKAALVAQAEAANQAAIEEPTTTSAPAAKSAQSPKTAKETSLEELDADQKKEQQKLQANAKYNQDKKMALDQGYSEEQAELYAKQEAYAASLKAPQEQTVLAAQTPAVESAPATPDSNNDASASAAVMPSSTVPKPVSGPTAVPPTVIGRDQQGAMKDASAVPVDAGSPVSEDIPIEQQIKQAQEQQALIKAQLEKKKQEKQNLLAMNQISAANDLVAQQLASSEAASANQPKAEAMAQQQVAAEQQALAQAQAQPEAVPRPLPEAQVPQEIQKQAEAIPAPQPIEQAPEAIAAAPSAQDAAQAQVAATAEQAKAALQQRAEAEALAEAQAQVLAADQQAAKEAAAPALQPQPPVEAPKELATAAIPQAPAPLPVQQPPAPQPAPPQQVAPALQAGDKKTHKKEKSTLQESEEIHRHTPKAIKKQLKILNQGKSRAQQYEEDLNRARDEIQKAQIEMKNIDSEVTDFHQKMAKSMHSLLKAFTEGFEAMDKAKSDELDSQLARQAADKKRASKLDKLNVGISNLEALTSKLKLSFGGDDGPTPASDSAVQANAEIQQPAAESKPIDQSFLNSKIKQEAQKLTIDNSKQPTQQVVIQQPKQQVTNKPQAPPAKTAPAVKQKAMAAQAPHPQPAAHAQQAAPIKPVAPQPNAVKIQPKTAVKTVQAVKKQAAPAARPSTKMVQPAKAQPVNQPKQAVQTVQIKKKGAPQQLSQAKAAKTITIKPVQRPGVAQKSVQSAKPALKAKMQNLLATHAKPGAAPKTAAKTVQVAKKLAPVQSKVIKKAPAAPVAKTLKLVRKTPVKPVAAAQKKALPKKAVGLAQLNAEQGEQSELDESSLLETFNQQDMQSLLETKDKLHHLFQSIGEPKEKQVEKLAKSYGIEMDDDMKEQAKATRSNKMIAHAIADRVLLQLESGKPEQSVMTDLNRTKQALKLAQKAFYDKDPEAIELLQLDESDKSVVDVSDKIFLFDSSSSSSTKQSGGAGGEDQDEKSFVQQLTENMDLIGDNENQSELKENEDEVQAQIDQDINDALDGKRVEKPAATTATS